MILRGRGFARVGPCRGRVNSHWVRLLFVLSMCFVVTVGCTDSSRISDATRSEEPVDDQAGTPLRDGLVVERGSRLLAPVLDVPASVLQYQFFGDFSMVPAWRATLVVEQDERRVWDSYVRQVQALVAAGAPGGASTSACFAGFSEDDPVMCEAFGRVVVSETVALGFVLAMRTTPADVTGGYLLTIESAPASVIGTAPDMPLVSTYEGSLPPVAEPAPQPRPGGLITPLTTVIDPIGGDAYVLLDDSSLLAIREVIGGPGGFEALLETEGDVHALATQYLAQTPSGGEKCHPAFTAQEASVFTCGPVGGAGGWSALITVIDRTDGADYLLYEAGYD